ncbi:MAG: DUF4907 domain-containing protein [Bacteroidota bacterium]
MNRSLSILLSLLVIIIALVFLLFVPSQNQDDEKTPPGTDGMGIPPKPDTLAAKYDTAKKSGTTSISVYPVDHGFGYDILMNGKPYIHQPYIPAIQGNKVFSSVEDAQKTAALVNFKIKNNINPPSISIRELDSLKIKR